MSSRSTRPAACSSGTISLGSATTCAAIADAASVGEIMAVRRQYTALCCTARERIRRRCKKAPEASIGRLRSKKKAAASTANRQWAGREDYPPEVSTAPLSLARASLEDAHLLVEFLGLGFQLLHSCVELLRLHGLARHRCAT